MRGLTLSVGSIVTALAPRGRRSRYSASGPLQRPMRDATGLFDADAFRELVNDRLERGLLHGGRAAVAVFELSLMDRQIGERTGLAIARAIRESIRPSDLAARFGPTTFVALLDRCEREEAKHVCSRIMRAVMTMDVLGSLCCGISVAPTDGSSVDQLISAATRRPAPFRVSERIVAAAS